MKRTSKNEQKTRLPFFLSVFSLLFSGGLFALPGKILAAQQYNVPWLGPATSAIVNGTAGAFTAALGNFQDKLITAGANVVLNLLAWVLWLFSLLLDTVIDFTVRNMALWVNSAPGLGGVINETWAVFRDLGNMTFFFIILYLAFQLILGIGSGHWRSLGWIIIMAILINFSLFFTKIVIDASNLLALIFYQAITAAPIIPGTPSGIAGVIMQQLGLATIFQFSPATITNLFGSGAASSPTVFLIGGSLFIIITIGVTLSLCLLFIIRFVYLIMLMILSPLAFACYVIPGLRGNFNKWWNTLIHQAFFAPAVFLLLWVSFKILGSLQLGNVGSFGDLLGKLDASSIPIVLNFALSIYFLVYSIILAQKFGAIGAAASIRAGKSISRGAQSFVGRNTIGRAAGAANDALKKTSFGRSSIGASTLAATTGALASSKYGGRMSYEEQEDKRKASLKKDAVDKAGFDANKLYETFTAGGYSASDRVKMFDAMDNRRKIIFEDEVRKRAALGGVGAVAANEALRVIEAKKGKMDREELEKLEEVYVKEFRESPEKIAKHLSTLSPELQAHIYDKLSPKDRIAVEKVLTGGGTTPPLLLPGGASADSLVSKLRGSLSREDLDKTEKASRESGRDAEQEKARRDVELIAEAVSRATRGGGANPFTSTGGTITFTDSAGTPHTVDKKQAQDFLSQVTDKTLQTLDIETLKALAPALSPGQYRSLQKSDLSPIEKKAISTERHRELDTALRSLDVAGVKTFMDKLKEEDVAALDDEYLMEPLVIKHLTNADLAKLAEKGTAKKVRGKIAEEIMATWGSAAPHPSIDYIHTGAGKDYWNGKK